jgi:hypothetical protein
MKAYVHLNKNLSYYLETLLVLELREFQTKFAKEEVCPYTLYKNLNCLQNLFLSNPRHPVNRRINYLTGGMPVKDSGKLPINENNEETKRRITTNYEQYPVENHTEMIFNASGSGP